MTPAPSRPALRYLGGKWRLAPWVIEHFPAHTAYVEAFGGAASVLLQKPRSTREVYNDIDGELVNLFSILRNVERRDQLVEMIRYTPYAHREFLDSFAPASDPLERARRLLVRSHMGHGTRGTGTAGSMGFRRDGMKGDTDTAGNWASFDAEALAIGERFRGVVIEQRPAIDLVRDFDHPEALIYLDPPYMPATRSGKRKKGEGYHVYGHEMSVDDHVALLDAVCRSRALIVISGYPSPLYEEALGTWSCATKAARSHRNSPRIEALWVNPACAQALGHGPLFGAAA